jgi:hypothetical protein
MRYKDQMTTWKNIGYDAQEIICQCENHTDIDRVKKIYNSINEKISKLDILELEKLNTENGIAIPEYSDMIAESLAAEPVDPGIVRNRVNALLSIIVDMQYGLLRNDAFYKKIAVEGETNC